MVFSPGRETRFDQASGREYCELDLHFCAAAHSQLGWQIIFVAELRGCRFQHGDAGKQLDKTRRRSYHAG